ncbi:hypothetical protein G3N96_34610 [Burkholderia sp. Se-20373]|uniref:hypothetical protein n=1 Tax=Burkholderia sp. Se-20373 TaxID=2703898 RepID=UPI00197FBFC1|nr:hypothetical protein [Burkholderia sp. Se-20373]MBN3750510.1 hypothetical protein [Burkholderia sp. Se-20373]
MKTDEIFTTACAATSVGRHGWLPIAVRFPTPVSLRHMFRTRNRSIPLRQHRAAAQPVAPDA